MAGLTHESVRAMFLGRSASTDAAAQAATPQDNSEAVQRAILARLEAIERNTARDRRRREASDDNAARRRRQAAPPRQTPAMPPRALPPRGADGRWQGRPAPVAPRAAPRAAPQPNWERQLNARLRKASPLLGRAMEVKAPNLRDLAARGRQMVEARTERRRARRASSRDNTPQSRFAARGAAVGVGANAPRSAFASQGTPVDRALRDTRSDDPSGKRVDGGGGGFGGGILKGALTGSGAAALRAMAGRAAAALTGGAGAAAGLLAGTGYLAARTAQEYGYNAQGPGSSRYGRNLRRTLDERYGTTPKADPNAGTALPGTGFTVGARGEGGLGFKGLPSITPQGRVMPDAALPVAPGERGAAGYLGSTPAFSKEFTPLPEGTDTRKTPYAAFDHKAPQIMSRLMAEHGLTREQAAGIVGNLGHESARFTAHQEANPQGGGIGWAQWTGPRRRAFEAWAQEKGLDIKSDEASYRFLTEGEPGEWKRALDAVKATKTTRDAALAFENTYERAGVKAYASRFGMAERAAQLDLPAPPTGAPGMTLPNVSPLAAGARPGTTVERLRGTEGASKSLFDQLPATPGGSPTPATANSVEENMGPSRPNPITPELKERLQYTADQTGLIPVVVSGGQNAPVMINGKMSSNRHTGGRAGDVQWQEEDKATGKRRTLSFDNPADAERLNATTYHMTRTGGGQGGVVTGVGSGYMGPRSIHYGGNNNPNNPNEPVTAYAGSDAFRAAAAKGWSEVAQGTKDLDAWREARKAKGTAAKYLVEFKEMSAEERASIIQKKGLGGLMKAKMGEDAAARVANADLPAPGASPMVATPTPPATPGGSTSSDPGMRRGGPLAVVGANRGTGAMPAVNATGGAEAGAALAGAAVVTPRKGLPEVPGGFSNVSPDVARWENGRPVRRAAGDTPGSMPATAPLPPVRPPQSAFSVQGKDSENAGGAAAARAAKADTPPPLPGQVQGSARASGGAAAAAAVSAAPPASPGSGSSDANARTRGPLAVVGANRATGTSPAVAAQPASSPGSAAAAAPPAVAAQPASSPGSAAAAAPPAGAAATSAGAPAPEAPARAEPTPSESVVQPNPTPAPTAAPVAAPQPSPQRSADGGAKVALSDIKSFDELDMLTNGSQVV